MFYYPQHQWAIVDRLTRHAQATAEAERRLLLEDRVRLARELHDIFGHTMAAISVQAGAALHVTRNRPDQVITALDIAQLGGRPGAPRISPHALESLTAREREVTALVAAGMNNAEIARSLFISNATVKTHVSRAMTKLGARDRAQLVAFAYLSGLVAAP
ncbi:response regulator transcription factor [Pseudonocardia eucalypti]